MTQEDKELLLKDLCARLPYNVYTRRYVYITPTDAIESVELFHAGWLEELCAGEAEFKPYLIPLYRMTDEQKSEMIHLSVKECDIMEYIVNNPTYYTDGFPVVTYYLVDFCNKNHLDFRGLIPKGLAIDATGKGIY